MKSPALLSRLWRGVSALRRDQRGVSAVEFAMILPLMVTLYLGSVEVTTGVSIQRKVTLTARTVADLASQVTSINNSDMTNIMKAATAVIAWCTAPCAYNSSYLKVTVSAVNIDANGVATVAWSDTFNGTARGTGSTVTLPTALNIANTQLIWSEVSYTYTPAVGYMVTGTMNLADEIYMRPRLSGTIARPTS